jgi:hypothetical protein
VTHAVIAFVTAIALAAAPAAETAPSDASTAAPTEAAPAEAPADAAPAAGWDDDTPPTGKRPAPNNAGTPTATATPPPPVPPAHPVDDDPRRDPKRGRGLIAGGATLMGLGALSLIGIAAPAAIVKRVALNRAERDTVIDIQSRESRYRRARIADDTMEGGFWAGIVALGVGITLTIVGGVMRSRARARANQNARVEPAVGGLTVRF